MNKGRIGLISAVLGHVETLMPYFFRHIRLPDSVWIEIETRDGDFLDAEYWQGKTRQLAILTHGLEGSSQAVYIRALAQSYLAQGWSVLAWNFRGCSGRMNRNLKLYHSGAYEDLADVVEAVHHKYQPEAIHLAGFSLGANLTLVFLAKMPEDWLQSHRVERALVVSPPFNLAASSRKLEMWSNRPYQWNFLRELKSKIERKAAQFPGAIDTRPLKTIQTVWEFDDHFTAPLHGFAGAADYYLQCSSLYQLKNIKTPVLALVAQNDPMLARANYPEIEHINPLLSFTCLPRGGHCGFWGMSIF